MSRRPTCRRTFSAKMRQVYKLIEAVRERPFLYNQSMQSVMHLAAKKRNWMEVAKVVHGREDKFTVNKVKMQWKSLRDAFVRHQRRRKQAKRDIRPYVYETEMNFLLPHIQFKERDDGSDDIPPQKFDVNAEECEELPDSALSENFHTDAESHYEPVLPHQMADVQRGIAWDHNVEYREPHPVDAFFHGIAQTVKQLRPIRVARLKKMVANIVMDAEMEEIEESEKRAQKGLSA